MLRDALTAALTYLGSHPTLPVRVALAAARLRLAVPVPAIEYLLAPVAKGLTLEVDPPGVRLTTSLDLFGTPITVRAAINLDEVRTGEGLLQVALTVRSLEVDAPAGSPAAMLIGRLDLSRPATLLTMLPTQPAMIAEALENRFVLDLLRVRALKRNAVLRRALAVLGPVLGIGAVTTDGDLLTIALVPHPAGLIEAVMALGAPAPGGDAAPASAPGAG